MAPPGSPGGGPHTIRHRDIRRTHTGLAVTIHSSKTIRPGKGVTLYITAIGSWICPVATWDLYQKAVPARAGALAFMLPNDRTLSATGLTAIMQAGLALYMTCDGAQPTHAPVWAAHWTTSSSRAPGGVTPCVNMPPSRCSLLPRATLLFM